MQDALWCCGKCFNVYVCVPFLLQPAQQISAVGLVSGKLCMSHSKSKSLPFQNQTQPIAHMNWCVQDASFESLSETSFVMASSAHACEVEERNYTIYNCSWPRDRWKLLISCSVHQNFILSSNVNVYYKYIIDYKFIAEAVYTDTHPFQRLIVFINIREYTILFFVLYNEQQA